MAALTWVGVTEPDLYFLTLHSSMTPPAGFNRGRYANPVMDALVERGRHELDPAARRRIYHGVQRLAAHDVPVAPLWWEDRIVVHSRRLHGFRPTPSGELTGLAEAWLE
jgi:peptide/nickel transport system substrate-binding protein